MFAKSKVFEKVYILELSYWTEGMPMSQYQKFLKMFGLPPIPEVTSLPEIIKTVDKDIPDLGVMGLKIITNIGEKKSISFEGCIGDGACVGQCPENALCIAEKDGDFEITIDLALCDGVACRRCERVCGDKVFDLLKLMTSKSCTDEP